jgi:hypothetical protein
MPTDPRKKIPKKKAQAVMAKRNHQNHQNRQNRISREEKTTLVGDIEAYLKRFLLLDDSECLAASAWVMAAWLSDLWDRFPHLAITSAEMRSGKTRFLEVLELITGRGLENGRDSGL